MKKLIAGMICLMLAVVTAQAQQAKQGVLMRVKAAVHKAAAQVKAPQPVKIPGDKRLVMVQLELQEEDVNPDYILHRYWHCPAVIFTKDGALAFDGECWKAFEEAAKLPVGPAARFFVDLGKLGDYTTGEHAGEPFYFMASYVADGPGNEYIHSVEESFVRSSDKTYIIYKRSLFNDPTDEENVDNSEVKKAIADYYAQQNLKDVTAETLSKYFRQQHARTNRELTPVRWF